MLCKPLCMVSLHFPCSMHGSGLSFQRECLLSGLLSNCSLALFIISWNSLMNSSLSALWLTSDELSLSSNSYWSLSRSSGGSSATSCCCTFPVQLLDSPVTSRLSVDRHHRACSYVLEGVSSTLLSSVTVPVIVGAYMHKVSPNIFFHFLWFYSSITFLSLFAHCDYFSQIFLYFCCCFIHSKSLSFQHGTHICFRLSASIHTCCVESNCTICIACTHIGALSGVEAGVGNRVYVGWDTHLHFPPQCSDNHWGGEM